MQDGEINLLDYLIVILKRKKMILGVTGLFAAAAALVSFVLPPVYRAETTVLPPHQSGIGLSMQMLGQAGGFPGFLASGLGFSSEDVYTGMLKSRTVADRIIDRFGLLKLYKADTREEARERLLEDAVEITTDKSGIIVISVEDRDPRRAAEMANAMAEELKSLSQGVAVSGANEKRLFFEDRLKQAKASLSKAEEEMRTFQERTGALQIDEQAKAVIEGIAQVKARIAAREVESKVMGTYATSSNPDLRRANEELRGLKAELAKLEARGAGGHNPLMPTGSMPGVGTEYVRKLRELKFSEALYELLLKQYEGARLEEAGSSATPQVIDMALPPEERSGPKRALIMAGATMAGLLFAIVLAFFAEFAENFSGAPGNRGRIEHIRRYLSFRA